MGVDSAALVRTLNKTCLNALQSAAGLCLSRTNPSVEVEHWLIKLIEVPDSDLTRIFRNFEVDTSRLLRDLTHVLDGLRTGNERTPNLSLMPVANYAPRDADCNSPAWWLPSCFFCPPRSSSSISAIMRSGMMRQTPP